MQILVVDERYVHVNVCIYHYEECMFQRCSATILRISNIFSCIHIVTQLALLTCHFFDHITMRYIPDNET